LANDKPTSGGTTAEAPGAVSAQRLGGIRADFVASLGRKIHELRDELKKVEAEPRSDLVRDTLRRKLHALGTGARALHFEAMASHILDAEAVLDRASEEGLVTAADLEQVGRALDEMPTLAWSVERPASAPLIKIEPEPSSEPESAELHTVSVLIVGPEDLADMLVEEMGADEAGFECQCNDDLARARSTALAMAPDVVILDGDLPGAADFAEQFLEDPLTELTPVVVVMTPGPDAADSRFRALGVARVMPRPLLAGALRSACQEIIDVRDGKTVPMTLGEPTVEQLGERLALEVRRALVDAVDAHGRTMKVSLGDGAEVWGALWGAIARVREVVATSTGGMVHYSGHGPEGAVALAPMLAGVTGGATPSDRSSGMGRSRDEAMNVNLAGRKVLVADDDPGVTWFISDLLRTAGCVVYEALDGKTALQMAYELSPELLVSDILMPGLDGFALCRALKRDVALRDTPVILLSWKEDLLQRVRELGASAAAYLRKESDAGAILARVREVLRPRARIAARLRGQGEVRGRLDGLTVRTLFELVLAARPAARVSVRDASFLYELELRAGGIHRASRTSGDGTFIRGERVIAAMLGIGAGRFIVSSTKAGAADAGAVPLAEQFAKPIALARSALHATTGARMMTVAKIEFDQDDINGYVLATPEPARELVRRLARGTPPREILLSGDVSPALVEDVLADLATRGVITAVYRADGSNAMRGEGFDPKVMVAELVAGAPIVLPMAPRAPAPKPAAEAPPPETPAPPAEGSLSEPTEPAKLEFHDAAAGETPPPATTLRSSGDASIPLTVEPTDDLRPRAKDADSAPLSARRPQPRHAPEPTSFPLGLAIALGILLVIVAVLGAREWMAAHPHAASAPTAEPPVVAEAPGVRYDGLPPGVAVPQGQGLLSVMVAEGVPVRVDGADARQPRQGRTLRLPLPVGVHLVAVGTGDSARTRIVEVRAGRATSVDLQEP
jgi:DNA-binding response OmpR family regulator